VRYLTDVGSADTLTFGFNGTYLSAYDVAFTPAGDSTNLKNRIYNPLTFKARASVAWNRGPLTLRGEIQHVGGYLNDIVEPDEKVDAYNLVDLVLNWRITDSLDGLGIDGLTLGLEARNIFNTDPPYVNSRQGQNSGGGYDPTVTNPIGRQFAISLRARF
jgi:iron complex outermembrane receptor protein